MVSITEEGSSCFYGADYSKLPPPADWNNPFGFQNPCSGPVEGEFGTYVLGGRGLKEYSQSEFAGEISLVSFEGP